MKIEDLKAIVDTAFDEVEQQLYYAIKTNPVERDSLLSQLDVLTKLKERMNVRF
jgi:hypothetical protein